MILFFMLVCIALSLNARNQESLHNPMMHNALQTDHHENHHQTMNHMLMHSSYGNYSMKQDASGSSWQPDTTPWYGLHTRYHNWNLMAMGFANFVADHQGSRCGGNKFFSTSMLMPMAQHYIPDEPTIFTVRAMLSLDPLMGKRGYPLLFQTGETANGKTPLINRQHPHDLVMELAGIYSYQINDNQSFFVYLALPGEPALGPPVYFMRYSSLYNPEAPLTHHWLDSTHVQFGVATIGYIADTLKIDCSIFTGREPDQYRYNFDKPRFDSYAARITYNPTADISCQISYGYLKGPEQLEQNVNVGRTTASILYNKNWINKDLQLCFAWGRNKKKPGIATNAFLGEFTLNLYENYIFFGRAERVGKDELVPTNNAQRNRVFKINKITLGGLYQRQLGPIFCGLGALGSVYPHVPATLQSICQSHHPLSWMVFLQMRLHHS